MVKYCIGFDSFVELLPKTISLHNLWISSIWLVQGNFYMYVHITQVIFLLKVAYLVLYFSGFELKVHCFRPTYCFSITITRPDCYPLLSPLSVYKQVYQISSNLFWWLLGNHSLLQPSIFKTTHEYCMLFCFNNWENLWCHQEAMYCGSFCIKGMRLTVTLQWLHVQFCTWNEWTWWSLFSPVSWLDSFLSLCVHYSLTSTVVFASSFYDNNALLLPPHTYWAEFLYCT